MMRLCIAICFLVGALAQISQPYPRKITFINGCKEDIWVQGTGNLNPLQAGFRMKQGASPVTMNVGINWGGRLWGSTGCSFSANGTWIPGTCKTCDNGFQCTLLEIGVSSTYFDFYDISLVDGYSMGISVFTDVPRDIHLGEFNCGNATCDQFNTDLCPPEMKLYNPDGSFHFCQKSCSAIRNTAWREQFPYFNNLWNATDPYQGFPQRDNICCDCGTASDGTELGYSGCSDTRSHYCCRPNPSNPHGGICYYNQWPKSSNGLTYYNVFKSQCKTAYAHDNDDAASTFICAKSANYTVVFCALPDAYVQPPPLGCPAAPSPSCLVTNNSDVSGTNLDSAPLTTTDACCAWCLSNSSCTGWAYTPGNCYLKSGTVKLTANNGVYGGIKTAAGVACPAGQSTAAPCYCGAGYAGTLTTTTASAPSSSIQSISSSPTKSSSSPIKSSSSSSIQSSSPVLSSSKSSSTTSGCKQTIGYDYYGGDLSNAQAANATVCCNLCSSTLNCNAWTWVPATCYMKSQVNGLVTNSNAIAGLRATSSFLEKYAEEYPTARKGAEGRFLGPL